MAMPRTATAALAGLLAAAVVALPATALGKGGGSGRDVLKIGSCTASSTAKVKLSPENGRLEVELEVDQNRNGVRWNWTLKRAGAKLAAGSATIRPPSGSFHVRRVISNAPGADTIVATATRGGERCTVKATI
jgi:hypothetical protein